MRRVKSESIALFLLVSVALITGYGCRKPVRLKNLPPRNDRICCFGDSLVFGTGAANTDETYPAFLSSILVRNIVRWGTPGDTTAQALVKCDRFIQEQFGVVIVTIGGNDIIQRVRWPETERNLIDIFKAIQGSGAVVVFTGVTGPLNPTRNKLYKKMCREMGVYYIPEILDRIKGNPDLSADSVHPNSKGYRIMAERVAEALQQANLLQ